MKRKDNIFNSILLPNVESSLMDLGHEKKFTFNMGELVPVSCMEVIPGDKFRISFANFLRFAPLVSPVMHRVRVKTEYFFVPNRIIFDEWESFITGVGDPVLAPTFTLDDVLVKGTLGDYLGIPPGDYDDNNCVVSALPLAAYFKIYDDWYRDQNLIDPKFIPLTPGDNDFAHDAAFGLPLKRAWEHDYFTSALPTTQQGADVEIPLVNLQNIPVQLDITGNPIVAKNAADGTDAILGVLQTNPGPTPLFRSIGVDENPAVIDPNGTLVVDVQSEAATINDLREAWSLQAFLERTIRGGARYIEQIWSHFRVKSSDARLQRPELIGTYTQNMVISEVLATAQSNNDGATAEIGVGTMAGHGISSGGADDFYYEAEEHGFIIGLISVIPDTAYQDGIPKLFFKTDRFDYAFPSFAHLGEQPVLNKEIMSHDTSSGDWNLEGVFGYLPRYSEYRYVPSTVAGDFRDTLAFWTLGRRFDPLTPPLLNEEFVTCNPSRDIFAVTDANVDTIYAQVINNHTAVRKLPRYGVPSTI